MDQVTKRYIAIRYSGNNGRPSYIVLHRCGRLGLRIWSYTWR